ncbi:hypothetical protein DFH09DRAFT_1325561 [Mycena vulgaris]|nr:hypothetical protein DFH09DRAFT_1325561 [Mycena vulgaris]
MYPAFRFATFAGSLRAHCAFTAAPRDQAVHPVHDQLRSDSPQKLALERKTVTVPIRLAC